MDNTDVTNPSLYFEVFGTGIQVYYDSPHLATLITSCYTAFETDSKIPTLTYRISTNRDGSGYTINNYELDQPQPVSDSELIYSFEKDIELKLQRTHPSWYFIHGAAVSYQNKIGIFMAPSGSGKSTLAWALLNHGFTYMSDELAPVDLTTLTVNAYPHALCLKSLPPEPYGLPEATFQTQRTMHIPVHSLPDGYTLESGEISALFFVLFNPDADTPSLSSVSKGEAAAELYANGLNQLAHDNKGLSAAATIANRISAYKMTTTRDLSTSAQQVKHALLG